MTAREENFDFWSGIVICYLYEQRTKIASSGASSGKIEH